MDLEFRCPDGDLREISLSPQDGGLVATEQNLRFERAGDDSLWLIKENYFQF